MINEIKSIIREKADSLFATAFSSNLTGDKIARSVPPLLQREPEMPQELIDMLD